MQRTALSCAVLGGHRSMAWQVHCRWLAVVGHRHCPRVAVDWREQGAAHDLLCGDRGLVGVACNARHCLVQSWGATGLWLGRCIVVGWRWLGIGIARAWQWTGANKEQLTIFFAVIAGLSGSHATHGIVLCSLGGPPVYGLAGALSLAGGGWASALPARGSGLARTRSSSRSSLR